MHASFWAVIQFVGAGNCLALLHYILLFILYFSKPQLAQYAANLLKESNTGVQITAI